MAQKAAEIMAEDFIFNNKTFWYEAEIEVVVKKRMCFNARNIKVAREHVKEHAKERGYNVKNIKVKKTLF